MSLDKRIGGAALAALLLMPSGLAALELRPAPAGTYRYVVTHDRFEGPIGTQVVEIADLDGSRTVTLSADVSFRYGPLNIFEYVYEGRQTEIWANGRLARFDSRVLDDGEEHLLTITAAGERYQVTTHWFEQDRGSPLVVASGWNHAVLGHDPVMDAKTGLIARVTVENRGDEMLALADGTPTMAHRFEVTGDMRRTLWYAPSGLWLRLEMPRFEGTLAFTLDPAGGPRVGPKDN